MINHIKDWLTKCIPARYLGKYDAMVLIRTHDKELCFVMDADMSDETFIACCKKLRESVSI